MSRTSHHILSAVVVEVASRNNLLLSLIALFGIALANAQPKIISYNAFVNSGATDHARVISLANDLQPAVYVENNEMKIYGESAVCLYTDMVSAQKLSQYDIPVADIEMIIIRINAADELKQKINFGQLSDFPKLKYVYLLATIALDEKAFKTMAAGNTNYIILFHTAKSS